MKRISRIMTALSVVLVCFVMLFGTLGCTSTNIEGTQTGDTNELTVTANYKINIQSTIKDDFEYFGISMKSCSNDLALSDLYTIFPDGNSFYLFFQMPEDTNTHEYRVKKIIINDAEYELLPLNVDGNYQKYIAQNCKINDEGKYEISKITYIDNLDSEYLGVYSIPQICTLSQDDTSFKFTQEHHYNITLSGKMFESVYQFDKNNVLMDLWNNAIANTEGLDKDKRSFFYFAFNCYDIDRDIKFLPEDILQLTVNYTQAIYEYKGKNEEDAKNIVPEKKTELQTITPDSYTILAKNSKRSNGLSYIYKTINKLTDADLEQNTGGTNKEALYYAAKSYDWAVSFGEKSGYRNADIKDIWGNYDISYTKMEELSTIDIVYVCDGTKVSTDVNSLISNKPTTITEKYHKPSDLEKYASDNAKSTAYQAQTKWYEVGWNVFLNMLKSFAFWIVIIVIILCFVFKLLKPTPLLKHILKSIKAVFTKFIGFFVTLVSRHKKG